ncbi:hypothetical protein GCM10027601_10670 [Nocardioides ungokensis]
MMAASTVVNAKPRLLIGLAPQKMTSVTNQGVSADPIIGGVVRDSLRIRAIVGPAIRTIGETAHSAADAGAAA